MCTPKSRARCLARWLCRGLLALFIGLLVALGVALYLAVDDQPLVAGTPDFTPEHIARAKLLLERNDPRQLRHGQQRSLAVSQEDVDLAVNYLAHRLGQGAASIVLQNEAAKVLFSVLLPSNPVGPYLNLTATLVETPSLPRLDGLRLGRLPIPVQWANWALHQAVAHYPGGSDYQLVLEQAITRVSARKGWLHIDYQWSDQLPDRLRSALVAPEDLVRAKAYQTRLAEFTHAPMAGGRHLSSLVQALFELAALRVTRQGGTGAREENRVAIMVLTFYVNGHDLATILPAARQWPVPVARAVTLGGRPDFAQHFMVSAALAATSGSPLSNAVGLYKEVADSRGDSGFSFNDIAADHAGTRFGEKASTSESAARTLQRRIARGIADADLLPKVDDLPEFMQEAEFKARFGGVGMPAYQAMLDDIERRVSALALYR